MIELQHQFCAVSYSVSHCNLVIIIAIKQQVTAVALSYSKLAEVAVKKIKMMKKRLTSVQIISHVHAMATSVAEKQSTNTRCFLCHYWP